jgi:Dyp-type peroxidase family
MTNAPLSRRAVLRAGGLGAALGTLGPFLPVGEPRAVAAGEADPTLELADIQGNVLAGFNKDHQRLLFLRFGDGAAARRWLGAVTEQVATADEVLRFNQLFADARARRGSEVNVPTSQWVNVALTASGVARLGAGTAGFPDAFRQGMAARARRLGDDGPSAPERWVGPFAAGVDALLLLAADDPGALAGLVTEHVLALGRAGIRVAFDQAGETRADQPGHEHFGFRDGISQPGIRGVTARRNPADPDQGDPGQDLLWPGEFVLGHPTQIPRPQPGQDTNDEPGPISRSGPSWTRNGSYLVFRRLRQDVPGFRAFVAATAAAQGISPDLMGAKLVGRFPSGAPLEAGGDDPANLDPSRINDFEFGADPDGRVVPRAAHIRKVYPRDSRTRDGGESETQTHRMLRRGIPYGPSYDGSPASAAADRGLLFLCYQSSIERQFEFVQSRWVNDEDFPRRGDGVDPLVSQRGGDRSFTLPGGRPDHVALLQRFVTTTGGAYLFQPSISALRQLAAGTTVDDRPPAPGPAPRPAGGPRPAGNPPPPPPRPRRR